MVFCQGVHMFADYWLIFQAAEIGQQYASLQGGDPRPITPTQLPHKGPVCRLSRSAG
jgi:hypothetical protein